MTNEEMVQMTLNNWRMFFPKQFRKLGWKRALVEATACAKLTRSEMDAIKMVVPVVNDNYTSPSGGADDYLDCYAAGSKAFRYSIGLFAPNDILILFPLYQYKYSFTVFINSSMLTPNHFLL